MLYISLLDSLLLHVIINGNVFVFHFDKILLTLLVLIVCIFLQSALISWLLIYRKYSNSNALECLQPLH